MTDEDQVEPLVDDAVGDAQWGTTLSSVGATADTEPTALHDGEREKFLPYDLTAFLNGKALWAANYFVLWPLGLSLVVDVETEYVEAVGWCGDQKVHAEHRRGRRAKSPCRGTRVTDAVTNLHVRTWEYPEGELGETIDQEQLENQADYDVFLGYVRERVLGMKIGERHLALRRLSKHGVAEPGQLLVAS